MKKAGLKKAENTRGGKMEDTQEEEKEGWSEKWNDPLKGNHKVSLPSPIPKAGRALRSFGTQNIVVKPTKNSFFARFASLRRQSDLNRHIFNNHHALNGIEDS